MHSNLPWRALVAAALSCLLGACAVIEATSGGSAGGSPPQPRVQYRTAVVKGIRIFYREAGDPRKPTLLLLHGFPSSSHMYRELIPLLSNDFHLVAPDYPGSGFSEAPAAETFAPTFDNLADVMAAFVAQVGLQRYTLYLQDFGGPVGLRMAVKNPAAVEGLVIQNANAYVEGIAPDQLDGMRARARGLTPEGRRQVEQLVSRDFTLFMYRTGSRDFASVDPTGWNLDALLLENPEARRIQVGLMSDYFSNVLDYPRWQAFLRTRPLKTLIVWGRNDPIFLPAGAHAYLRDIPGARLRFLDTGHFALEEDVLEISREIRAMFADRQVHAGLASRRNTASGD